MESVGPYRIREPLGAGGMGTVYRAVHGGTGDEVALKTLRAGTPELAQALNREVRALAALRHPGIVRIVDSGTEAGVPWYAMELVRGRSLRSVGRTRATEATSQTMGSELWWTAILDEPAVSAPAPPRERPADLARLLLTVQRLCGTLAWLHGEGLVHRDLKPDNVILKPDGWPVLVDFGIVAGFAGGRIRESGPVGPILAGTAPYMAPEQCRGELVDARADLYAVGCLLYDLVTGAPPFTGRDAALIFLAHQREAPVPPSRISPDVPAELDAIVLRLLAKDPRDRFGCATDVARALAKLTGGPPDAPGPPPRPHLCRPAFTGQAAVAAGLEARLERGGLTLVVGGEGLGRTRLALEAARWARQADRQVLSVDAGGAGPLAPLAPAIARIAPSLKPLPWPAPAAVRARWFERLLQAIAVYDRPCFVAVDDVHRADVATIELLAWLSHQPELADGPLHVVVTCRAGEVPAELARLGPSAARLELALLGPTEIRRLASEALGMADGPAPIVDAVASRAEGSPFLAGAFLHTAVALGLLDRDDGGRWALCGDVGDLPRTAEELGTWRLAPLDPLSRRLVIALAVLRRAGVGPVAELAGADRDVAEDALAALARVEIVQDEPPDAWRVGDRLAAAALASVDADERRRLHARAAEVLRRWGAGPGAVAPHLAAAGDRAGALAAWHEAAADAEGRSAFREAIEHHRAWLGLGDAFGREALDVRLRLASALRADGRANEAAVALVEARAVAERLGEAAVDEVELAEADRALHTGGEIRERVAAVAERARSRADPACEATALHLLARVHRRAGAVQESLDAFERSARLFEAGGAGRKALGARHGAATLLAVVGRLAEAEAAYRALAERGGEELPGVHWGLGIVAAERGRFAEALAHLQRAQERVEGAGWSPHALAVAINRSFVALLRGDAPEVLASARNVVAKAEYDPVARWIGRMNEGIGLWLAGREPEAAERLTEARERLAALGAAEHAARAAWWAAWFAIERGDPEEAHARLGAAAEVPGVFDGRVLAARIAREAGDLEAAEAWLAEGWPPREGVGALMWWCERGELTLARGEDANEAIARAQALFAETELARRGPVGARLASLESHVRGPASSP